MWHRKYSSPCAKVLGFVDCQCTSKVVSIVSAEIFWGDVKIIKSGKRSAISSDVSKKYSIVYTSTCIESDIIEQYHYENLNGNDNSHTWNAYNDAFDQHLGTWGVEKLFSDEPESVTRVLIVLSIQFMFVYVFSNPSGRFNNRII